MIILIGKKWYQELKITQLVRKQVKQLVVVEAVTESHKVAISKL